MKHCLISFLSLLLIIYASGQVNTASPFSLGFQEFPTTIRSHAAGASGSQYYSGVFRGELKVNGQVVGHGTGQEDIFWIKTLPGGHIMAQHLFGSDNSDAAVENGLAAGPDGSTALLTSSADTIRFGNVVVRPYEGPAFNLMTFHFSFLDSNGSVKWVRKTNLPLSRVFFHNGVIHALGISNFAPVQLRVDETPVFDSLRTTGIIHLMFDLSGNLLGKKSIMMSGFHSIFLQEAEVLGNGHLFFAVRMNSSSFFSLNGAIAPLPNNQGMYEVFIRTDTSYTQATYKVLNPAGTPLSVNASPLPVDAAPNDSVYAIINTGSVGNFFLDGWMFSANANSLAVFDSNLNLGRMTSLSSSLTRPVTGNITKRKILFRHIEFLNGSLFFTGNYTGTNESPLNTIPAADTLVNIIRAQKLLLDLNGPSKSFVAKSDLATIECSATWYGDHTEYETSQLQPSFLNGADNRIYFVQRADNVWNPWIFDNQLNKVSGEMKKAADLPDLPFLVNHFADGSRIIIGLAAGKTALDSSNHSLRSNFSRRDAFMVRIRPNNEVVWYKRFHSTLLACETRKLEVFSDGRAYFLINYFNSVNDTNFIRMENNVYDVKTTASLFASVDTSGNLQVLNLTHPSYRYTLLKDFTFRGSEMFALTDAVYPVSYRNFSGQPTGFHLLQLQPPTGELVHALRFFGSHNPLNLAVDYHRNIYIGTQLLNNSNQKLFSHDGNVLLDSIAIVPNPNSPFNFGVLKLSGSNAWKFDWHKRFTGGAAAQLHAYHKGFVFIVNKNPVLLVNPLPTTQPFYWDGQQVSVSSISAAPTFIGLTSAGVVRHSKFFEGISAQHNKVDSAGKKIFLSGMVRAAVQADTISIGNMGVLDALALEVDSSFVARRHFRVATPYSENMLDFHIFQDSVVTLAYAARVVPQILTSRMTALPGDYDENGYVGSLISRPQLVTAINEPLPPLHAVTIAPNPLHGRRLELTVQATENLSTVCTVYNSHGQFVTQKTMPLSAGTNRQQWNLPYSLTPGIYYLVLTNRKWTTTRTVVIL